MSVFRDANGDEWRVQFDAFVLAEAKKDTGVDLADLSAGGWQAVETDVSALGRVLAVVCGDEIRARKMTGRDFAKRIRGESIETARAALLAEGADFFPQSEWSAIRANSRKRTTMAKQTEAMSLGPKAAEILPLLEAFTRLPEGIQSQLLKSGGDTSSLLSEDSESAAGPTVTPSPAVIASPEKSESSLAD